MYNVLSVSKTYPYSSLSSNLTALNWDDHCLVVIQVARAVTVCNCRYATRDSTT
jgi:hypothetical protein